jgi:hypothetical protein
MAEDLISVFCNGEGDNFEGPCQHFLSLTAECSLLKAQTMAEVFAKGRCKPHNMVKAAVKGNLRPYVEPKTHLAALTFLVSEHVKKQQLYKGWKIYFLKSYINRTAYCKVIGLLEKEGILPKGVCKNCVHLSHAKPYCCQKETINSATPLESENPYYQKKRNLFDRACKEGFEPYTVESLDHELETYDHAYSRSSSENLLERCVQVLAERAKQAQGKKRKQICERQYTIFCYLHHLLEQGLSRKEAVKDLVSTLGIAQKMLDRDLREIREYLARENVL